MINVKNMQRRILGAAIVCVEETMVAFHHCSLLLIKGKQKLINGQDLISL
jgi:hypothetical protein